MSEDRYTYPGEGDTSRDIDREVSDAEAVRRKQAGRQVTHPQPAERAQGTSADSPGVDPADRERSG
jgi:hypothetical protein